MISKINNNHIDKNLLFAVGSLHFKSRKGTLGAYNFLSDSIYLPPNETRESQEIKNHEIAHRIMAHYEMRFSGFHVLSRLVGISHTLLEAFLKELDEINSKSNYKISLYGTDFSNLELKTGNSSSTPYIVNRLLIYLERIRQVEGLYDMVFRSIQPMAELVAIDYTGNVKTNTDVWYLQKNNKKIDIVTLLYNKLRGNPLFKAEVSKYSKNFGGYDTKYGSFQKAMYKAWDAYNSIQDPVLRKYTSRLCMYILGIDADNNIVLNDPIHFLLNVQKDFVGLRFLKRELESSGKRAIEFIDSNFLSDLPAEFKEAQNRVEKMWLLNQLQITARERHDIIMPWSHVMSLQSDDPAYSFIKYYDFDNDPMGPTIFINGAYLIRAKAIDLKSMADFDKEEDKLTEDYLRKQHGSASSARSSLMYVTEIRQGDIDQGLRYTFDEAIEAQWWVRLILLESLRNSLKVGLPLQCPFRGWKIAKPSSIAHAHKESSYIKCGDNCYLKQWISRINRWRNLEELDVTCDV